MMMFYLVECTGEYDDYQEDAIEFSSDREMLEEKATQLNESVKKIELLRKLAQEYYQAYYVALDAKIKQCRLTPEVQKPANPPSNQKDYQLRASINKQNEQIRKDNDSVLANVRKEFLQNWVKLFPIPEELKNVLTVSEEKFNVHSFYNLRYSVKECVNPMILRYM